ncbi:MAG TPA: hypothetical protein VF786_03360 [Terriglobales bacterium]
MNIRVWQVTKITLVLLLIVLSVVLTNTIRYRKDKSRFLHVLAQERSDMQQTQHKLQETTHLLATAEKKLGFLNRHKTMVQVTAFTGHGSFANGSQTDKAYAVPSHVLPEDRMLSIALSPTAQQKLHARMNDYILLLDKGTQKAVLARFVDTTSQDEARPVVDVFFEKTEEALTFGRQQFIAINISQDDSPFRIE